MLASITPLGERSRGFPWAPTAVAFATGALAAGALAGAAGGAIGALAPGGTWRTVTALALVGCALALDATPLARRLPTTRRQVNEDWLTRYRGWVYGVGFGAQLGVGLATVVTCAAVYAAAAGTVVVGTVTGGLAIGAAFGLVRGLSLAPAARVRSTRDLLRLHELMSRREAAGRWLVPAAEAVAIALLIGSLG